MRVVRRGTWFIHHAGIGDTGASGITGQVTECLSDDGLRFYVREGLAGIDHFMLSGNARLGMKQGRPPKGSYEVLHLVCEVPDAWEHLGALVASLDEKKRPVVRHRGFTVGAAIDALTRRPLAEVAR